MFAILIPDDNLSLFRGTETGIARIAGCRFFAVRFKSGGTERALERRIKKPVQQMLKKGVRTCVLPRGFALTEHLKKLGIAAADDFALRCRCGADIAESALDKSGISAESATLLVRGDSFSPAAGQVLLRLAPRVRYVGLCMRGGEEICERLRREMGISVNRCGDCSRQSADITVDIQNEKRSFDVYVRRGAAGEGERLSAAPVFTFPDEFSDADLEVFDKTVLLCALHSSGSLDKSALKVIDTRFSLDTT